MKKLMPALFLLIFSGNAFSLSIYDSLSDSQKSVLKTIVAQLGIKDDDNSIKEKLYNESSFIFDQRWSSYWTGLNELARSNYQDGREKGFVEIALNNSEHGTIFLTYIYKPETNQIILVSRQIRHGSNSLVLEEFNKRKADTDSYVLRHESGNYALLQKKGKVSFEFFHVSGNTGSLVYQSQTAIDL